MEEGGHSSKIVLSPQNFGPSISKQVHQAHILMSGLKFRQK